MTYRELMADTLLSISGMWYNDGRYVANSEAKRTSDQLFEGSTTTTTTTTTTTKWTSDQLFEGSTKILHHGVRLGFALLSKVGLDIMLMTIVVIISQSSSN